MGKGQSRVRDPQEDGFFGIPGVDTGMSVVKEAGEALRKALA